MNIKPFFLGLLAIIFNTCDTPNTASLAKVGKNPNIVFILADDLGYGDIGVYGQQKIPTPNIDALAKQGIVFTQHYSGSTVCAPSRSSIMTGQHTGNTYIRGNKEHRPEGQIPIPSSQQMLSKMLKASGYVTGAFGKWGLGYPQSEGDPQNQGFDVFYGYNCQRIAHNYYPYHLWDNQTKVVLEENYEDKLGVYAPDLIHQKALEFLEKNKDTTFFLYYPTVLPHAELIAPEKDMQKFRGKFGQEEPYKGVDSGPRYKNGGYMSQEVPLTAFAAMISLLDQHVGEISKQLQKLDVLENTIIIFTSDNGPHLEGGANPNFFNSNGGLRGYKRDLYEGGIRVPLVVSWPKYIKGGLESDHISAGWDFYATFADLLKAKTPEDSDGLSFLPILRGNFQEKHPHLYWEFHEQGGKMAVRMNKWKGIRLFVNDSSKSKFELYNLAKDPQEKFNVATQNPDIVQKIKAIMSEEHTTSLIFPLTYENQKP